MMVYTINNDGIHYLLPQQDNTIKYKKYHTVRTVPKSNRKIVERC